MTDVRLIVLSWSRVDPRACGGLGGRRRGSESVLGPSPCARGNPFLPAGVPLAGGIPPQVSSVWVSLRVGTGCAQPFVSLGAVEASFAPGAPAAQAGVGSPSRSARPSWARGLASPDQLLVSDPDRVRACSVLSDPAVAGRTGAVAAARRAVPSNVSFGYTVRCAGTSVPALTLPFSPTLARIPTRAPSSVTLHAPTSAPAATYAFSRMTAPAPARLPASITTPVSTRAWCSICTPPPIWVFASMHAPSPIVAPGAIDAVGWTWALGWIRAGATQGLGDSSTVGSPGDAIAPPSRRLGSPLPKSVPFRATASAAIVVLLLTRHSGSTVAPARTWTSFSTTEPAPTVAPGPIRVPFPIDAPASMCAPRPISQFSLIFAPAPICAPGSTSALGWMSASGDTPGGRDPGSRFPHLAGAVSSSSPCTDVSVSRAGSESTLAPVTVVHPHEYWPFGQYSCVFRSGQNSCVRELGCRSAYMIGSKGAHHGTACRLFAPRREQTV